MLPSACCCELKVLVVALNAGFEILGNLCLNETNMNLMCVHLDEKVFTTALHCLLLPDIELVLAALEMLYRLTKQNMCDVCTRIAHVSGSIGKLSTDYHHHQPQQCLLTRVIACAMLSV